ncbi:hypothetical protein [Clostridium beijerinckii]|uniref:hypothetical protein n=1 Tax=Clostridium beijerinckii TaxID=1520 RepID=UPI001F3D9624|nr:hypothetical protein [Clostridium beijerinckii]
MNKYQNDLNKVVRESNGHRVLSYYQWRKITKKLLFGGKRYFSKEAKGGVVNE